MKSVADLKQSQILAGFLSVDSADFGYNVFVDDSIRTLPINDWDLTKDGVNGVKTYPAWSCAVLMDLIPQTATDDNGVDYEFFFDKEDDCHYSMGYRNTETGELDDRFDISYADELVDACVEMLIKLHENNML